MLTPCAHRPQTQRVSPKSYSQAVTEVTVTRKFFENFSGDQVTLGALLRRSPSPKCNPCRLLSNPGGPAPEVTVTQKFFFETFSGDQATLRGLPPPRWYGL